MIVIGEKLNSTLKPVRAAIESRNAEFVKELARNQVEAGASYVDLNAGMFPDDEPEKLEWLVKTVQEATDAPLSIDSANPSAISGALKAQKNGKPLINSMTGGKESFEALLPLVLEYNANIVALCMDDDGLPETTEDRVAIAYRLVNRLTAKGVCISDIYIDPLVRPIGTGSQNGNISLDTIRKVRAEFPEVHITCGISNISFGIPDRKVMNQAFLIAAMTAGLDSAILDPLDKRLMTFVYAAESLLGCDEFCMNYLMKFREGLLET